MDEDNMPMVFPNGQVYSREVSQFHLLRAQDTAYYYAGNDGDGCEEQWGGHLSPYASRV
jgi:hypothetical protein